VARAKKKSTKKRSTKSRKKGPKRIPLRKVPEKDYAIQWDEARNSCYFGHKKGIGGPIGCGVCDAIFVFSGNKKFYVLSVNYKEPYASVESFIDAGGVEKLLFAEPGDMRRIFGDDITHFTPKQIAERLAAMMEA